MRPRWGQAQAAKARPGSGGANRGGGAAQRRRSMGHEDEVVRQGHGWLVSCARARSSGSRVRGMAGARAELRGRNTAAQARPWQTTGRHGVRVRGKLRHGSPAESRHGPGPRVRGLKVASWAKAWLHQCARPRAAHAWRGHDERHSGFMCAACAQLRGSVLGRCACLHMSERRLGMSPAWCGFGCGAVVPRAAMSTNSALGQCTRVCTRGRVLGKVMPRPRRCLG